MTDRSGDRVTVFYVDVDGTRPQAVVEGLAAADGRIDATVLSELDRARDALAAEAPDCLVVACRAPDGPATEFVEWAVTNVEQVPVVAFADGTSGVAEPMLAAGVTDCVAAGGADGRAVLAHRVIAAAERSDALTDLRETEARFQALVENTNFAVVTIDEDSVVQYASDPVSDLFGYEPDELVGEPLTAIMPERFHGPHHEAIAEYLATGTRSLDWGWIELPGRRRDGTEFPLGVSFGERETADGRLFTAIIRDISEQREREEQLSEMATALDQSIDGIAIVDSDGRFEYVNDAHAEVYGYDDPDALVGEHWHVLYDDHQVAAFDDDIMPAVAEAGQWRGETEGVRADGSAFPQELSLTQLDDGGFVCVVRDVSERVERREQLEAERQFVETIINTLPDVFYMLDTGGDLTRWNDRMEQVTGYTEAELDSMHALALVPPEDHELIAESVRSVVEHGEPQKPRSALVTKQGDRIPYRFSGSQLTDADGEVVGLVGIGRDVTDEQLREQRLSVLSRVLRHNVRNRISVVVGHAEYVAEMTDDEELAESAAAIVAAAEALSETSERARRAEALLRDRPARTEVDLVDCVEAGLDEATLAPGCTVTTDVPASAPVIGTEDIAVAVRELVENASNHVTDPNVEVHVERDGDEVAVVVTDDGPGLPEHEQAVLAEETESPLEHSTGLGLWLVNWVTTTAGGRAVVREGGDGTAVAIRFSAVDAGPG